MAPRKKTTKAPLQPANPPARREVPESPPQTQQRTDKGRAQYRSLRTVEELRNVMGDESDSSLSNSENESFRNNTTQSRPNFSFLPSHKHSSPNTVKRTNPSTSTTSTTASHRLASMPTVSNTEPEPQDSSVASSTTSSSTSRRKPSRAVSHSEPSTSGRAPQVDKPQPSNRKQPHTRKQQTPGHLNVLKDIIKLQSTVHNLVPKMCFARVIREILSEYTQTALRVTPDMLFCLQEAAEIYLVQLFEDSYRCTLHRDRATLMPKDMKLACLLRRN